MSTLVTACAASLTAGTRVRVLRERAGWSQARLAAKAGLSPGMVSFLEAGRRNFTLPALERVAKALQTTAAALAGEPAGAVSKVAAVMVTVLRLEREWTTEELAGKAGIPAGTLALLEGGRLDFPVAALEQVAKALETGVAGLLQPVNGRAR